MIEGSCDNCGVKYSVDDAHAGKTSQCLMCEAEIRIPESGDVSRASRAADIEEELSITHGCQIATTDSIQGWTIVGYKGMVTERCRRGHPYVFCRRGHPYVFCRRGHPSAQRPDLFRRQTFSHFTLRRFVIGPFLGPGRLPNLGGRRFRPLAETDLDDSTWIRRDLTAPRVGPLFHGIRLSFGGPAHDGSQRLAWLFAGRRRVRAPGGRTKEGEQRVAPSATSARRRMEMTAKTGSRIDNLYLYT
jgi:hypothetical protein